MTKERDIEEDLIPSVGDYAHAGVRAGLVMAPYLGGPLAEFFTMVISPPLEKRREAWLIEIYTRLKRLEEQVAGFKIESLAQNETFVSTLFYATQAAMRTHQKEKLDALRNAVINTALRLDIDENLQLMFLNIVDRYTPWHLVILQFLDDPRGYGESRGIKYPSWGMGGTARVLEHTFPELRGKRVVYDQIVKELFSHGFLHSDTFLHATLSDMFAPETTEMGKQFLKYITLRTSE